MAVTKLSLSTNDDISIEHSRAGMIASFTAESSDILDHFSAAEVISHFGADAILDEIGESEAIKHFGIE